MNKVIALCLLQAITLNLDSMEMPEEDKETLLQQSEEKSECYFDKLPEELLLHIFGYTANQEKAKDRFEQVGHLSLVDKKWARLAKDEPFLKSILHSDAEFIALGKKLANDVSQGNEITWTCPSWLPQSAKEAIKAGLLKSPVAWNFFCEDRKAQITSVAISHDNSFIVTGFHDGTAKIWEVSSGKCIITTLEGHTDSIYSVAISSNNRFIVTGSLDKTAKIWDVSSGNCINTLVGHTNWIFSVAISSDNSFILTGSKDNTAKIWNAQSGTCLNTLEGHRNTISSVAISSDNSFIVTGSWDNTAKIWNAQSGTCLNTLEGYTGSVESVAISSDNSFIVTGSDDATAKIWDVQSGKCITTFEGHTEEINSVAISNDNRFIITGSSDYTVMIWDVDSGKCIQTLESNTDLINSVAISSDNSFMVTRSAVYPMLHNHELEVILEKINGCTRFVHAFRNYPSMNKLGCMIKSDLSNQYYPRDAGINNAV